MGAAGHAASEVALEVYTLADEAAGSLLTDLC